MTECERIKREHPRLWRWEKFKLAVTECLAKYLNIHLDW